MRLRAMMAQGADTLAAELDSVLGTAWDQALEVYRDGGDAGEVTWLSRELAKGLVAPAGAVSTPGPERNARLGLRSFRGGLEPA